MHLPTHPRLVLSLLICLTLPLTVSTHLLPRSYSRVIQQKPFNLPDYNDYILQTPAFAVHPGNRYLLNVVSSVAAVDVQILYDINHAHGDDEPWNPLLAEIVRLRGPSPGAEGRSDQWVSFRFSPEDFARYGWTAVRVKWRVELLHGEASGRLTVYEEDKSQLRLAGG